MLYYNLTILRICQNSLQGKFNSESVKKNTVYNINHELFFDRIIQYTIHKLIKVQRGLWFF